MNNTYMSPAAKSVFYFSFYLIIAGLALFIIPNSILSILGLPQTTEVWVNVAGLLTFILGIFFINMSKKDIHPFFVTTVYCRAIFALGIIILIVVYNAPTRLLLFSAVDVIGLCWTISALRSKTS